MAVHWRIVGLIAALGSVTGGKIMDYVNANLSLLNGHRVLVPTFSGCVCQRTRPEKNKPKPRTPHRRLLNLDAVQFSGAGLPLIKSDEPVSCIGFRRLFSQRGFQLMVQALHGLKTEVLMIRAR